MSRKIAFSVVELLTVVAVISVLATLLVPVLAKAQECARRASCIGNEHQLILTWLMYAADNDERLAQNGYTEGGGEPERPMWVQGYYNHAVAPPDSTNVLLPTDGRFAQFAPYLRTPKIYHCPADRQSVQLRGLKGTPGRKVVKIRSYSMNWSLGWINEHTLRNPPKEWRQFHKTCELQPVTASELMVFTDLHPESICWPFFGILATPEFFMFPGSYHKRRGIFAWADGHVEAKRWADDRTTGAVGSDGPTSSTSINWHMHEHPSLANQDLIWIQKHASVRR